MRKILAIIFSLLSVAGAQAQNNNNTVDLKELSVPSAPALKLIDAATTLAETYNTPKQFSVGIVQAFNNAQGWPQNYALQTTPYWWFNPNKSVYSLLGYDMNTKKENIFSGLQFTNVSFGFVKKDMVPDAVTMNQNVFTVGVNATVIKVHSKQYIKKLSAKVDAWHDSAQVDMAQILANIPVTATPAEAQAILTQAANNAKLKSTMIAQDIREMVNEKPIFVWDLSGAMAMYSGADTVWEMGRGGLWTSMAVYVPLHSKEAIANTGAKNYLDLVLYGRYMNDNFAQLENGQIGMSAAFDAGGKIAFEFDKITLGAEGAYRYYSDAADLESHRLVGFVSYQVGDNLYLNGTFGNDFSFNKPGLLTLLGLNWGFGSEKVSLPKGAGGGGNDGEDNDN